MSNFPPFEELIKLEDEMKAIHDKMHAFAKQCPNNHNEFIGVAVAMTDALRKLDTLIDRAKFVEKI